MKAIILDSTNQNNYKLQKSRNTNMIPGDPKGSPDESFIRMFPSDLSRSLDDLLKFLGGFYG